MNRFTRTLAWTALVGTFLFSSVARSADEVNVTRGATLAGPGLAVRGYDVVAYFSEGRAVLGSDQFAVAHEGGTYRFSSQKNLDAFNANPVRYTPAFGGFCAYGAAVGKKFDGDPLLWKIVDGRLFLNLNPEIQLQWAKDVTGNIEKGDENWRRIEHRAVGVL